MAITIKRVKNAEKKGYFYIVADGKTLTITAKNKRSATKVAKALRELKKIGDKNKRK